jgi:hypothetical protein
MEIPEEGKPTGKTIFVAPAPSLLPDDGILSYVKIESIYDFSDLADRTVALISEQNFKMIEILATNPTMFDITPLSLEGIPDSDYSAEYNSVTWNVDKVSYQTLVADIRHAIEVDATIAASKKGVYDQERSQYERKDGAVKSFEKFSVGEDEDIHGEEFSNI